MLAEFIIAFNVEGIFWTILIQKVYRWKVCLPNNFSVIACQPSCEENYWTINPWYSHHYKPAYYRPTSFLPRIFVISIKSRTFDYRKSSLIETVSNGNLRNCLSLPYICILISCWLCEAKLRLQRGHKKKHSWVAWSKQTPGNTFSE